MSSNSVVKSEDSNHQAMSGENIRALVLVSVVAFWLLFGLVGFSWSDHPPMENIGYFLMALVVWFAAVAAHWAKHNIRFAWFSFVVVLVTFWSIQS